MPAKAETFLSLQREILSLQGLNPASAISVNSNKIGQLNAAFPNGVFPFAAVHEFICTSAEEIAASSGFVFGLLSFFTRPGAVSVWITATPKLFPPALKTFGLSADSFIFMHPKNEKEALWVLEEALKCTSVAAVVGELRGISFTESRRLQLLIEKSGVGCFLLYGNNRVNTTASFSRWRVKPIVGSPEEGLPGLSYPRWHVQLLKVRNGKAADWQIEWREGKFCYASKLTAIKAMAQKKAV